MTKPIEVGDHVKIEDGLHKNEYGTVINIGPEETENVDVELDDLTTVFCTKMYNLSKDIR